MRTRNYIITSKCCVGTEFAIIISNILTLRSLDPCLPRTNIERKETYWLTGCFRSLTMQTTLTMLQKSSTTIRETHPSQMKQTVSWKDWFCATCLFNPAVLISKSSKVCHSLMQQQNANLSWFFLKTPGLESSIVKSLHMPSGRLH